MATRDRASLRTHELPVPCSSHRLKGRVGAVFRGRNTRGIVPGALATLLVLLLPATAHATFPGANWKIAFTSSRDGNSEIYSMNSDGSGGVGLANGPGKYGAPAWSPDGSKILFVSSRSG